MITSSYSTSKTYISSVLAGNANPFDPWSSANFVDIHGTVIAPLNLASAHLQPRKGGWSPQAIGTTTKVYTGQHSDFNGQYGIFNYCKVNKFVYTYQENVENILTVTIEVPWDEVMGNTNPASINYIYAPSVTWEILPAQKDISILSRGLKFPPFDDGGDWYDKGPHDWKSGEKNVLPTPWLTLIAQSLKNNAPTLNINSPFPVNIMTQYPDIETWGPFAQFCYNAIINKVDSERYSTVTGKLSVVFPFNGQTSTISSSIYNTLQSLYTTTSGSLENDNMPIVSDTYLIDNLAFTDVLSNDLPPSYFKQKDNNNTVTTPFPIMVAGGYGVSRPTWQLLSPTKLQCQCDFNWGEWLYNSYRFPEGSPYPSGSTYFPLV